VDIGHGLACLLHRQQGLVIDVGRLYRINLCFQRPYLRQGLVQSMFVRLLAPQGLLGH
jgi:hypothetical protein